MAKPKLVAPTDDAPPATERQKVRIHEEMAVLAAQATYEVDALVALLSRASKDEKPDTFVYAARGIGRRIDTLNGIMMCFIHNSEFTERDVRTFEHDLYG